MWNISRITYNMQSRALEQGYLKGYLKGTFRLPTLHRGCANQDASPQS
jgi:hypothetical protein